LLSSAEPKLGGNEKFKSFISTYGSEGGYTKGVGMNEKYNSWAAAQYREKVGTRSRLLFPLDQ